VFWVLGGEMDARQRSDWLDDTLGRDKDDDLALNKDFVFIVQLMGSHMLASY